MTDEFNEGPYADKRFADQWVELVRGLKDEIRDKEIYPWLSKWIKSKQPEKILEIGSGTGICFEKTDLNGAEYTGVEPSVHLRDIAEEAYPDAHFLAGRAESLPIAAESMDAAFSVFVWLHISDLNAAGKELSRVLKPGGAFAIVTANPDAYDLWISWHTDPKVSERRLVGDFKGITNHEMILNTLDEIKRSLADNGLVVDELSLHGPTKKDADARFAVIISGHKI